MYKEGYCGTEIKTGIKENTTMIKMAILGAGSIAVKMAATITKMDQVEAYAIAARDLQKKTDLQRLMAPMRKCWQTRQWIWYMWQFLIPIITK